GIAPLALAEKEGLALINGTDGMLGMLVLAAADLRALLKVADITAAMSVEALLGTDAAFDAGLQALRPHPGQAASAANLRLLLAGSPIVASHKGPGDTRGQAAYSLRCRPEVHGAAPDTAVPGAAGPSPPPPARPRRRDRRRHRRAARRGRRPRGGRGARARPLPRPGDRG